MCKENHFYVYLRKEDCLPMSDASQGKFVFDLSSLGGGTDLSQYQGVSHCEVKLCNFITNLTSQDLLIKAMAPMPNSLESAALVAQTSNYNIKSSNIIAVLNKEIVNSAVNTYEHYPVKIMNIFRGTLTLQFTTADHAAFNWTNAYTWKMNLRVTFNDDLLDKVNEAVHQIKLKPFTSNLLSS